MDAGDRAALADLRPGLTALVGAADTGSAAGRLLAGHPVDTAQIPGAVLPRDLADAMARHGLLIRSSGHLSVPFQIRLVDGAVIVTDRFTRGNRAQPEFVDPLWGGPTLNKLLVRGGARRALDVGCGCGVMTIAAAAFCDHVVSLDINPRALALSRFNLALNGIENAEVRHSDLFEAVRGERFDRIIFNAPTGAELRPRNWLEAGEPILERFFSAVLNHLEDDGYAHVSLCFLDRRGSSFWDRLNQWLGGRANTLQVAYLERSRVDGGLPFLTWRALALLRDRANPFDVTAVSRGWLVLTRGTPRAVRLPLDYKRAPETLKPEFGDRLIRHLLGTSAAAGLAELQAVWAVPAIEVQRCLQGIHPIVWG
jgi:SAM-dependent methyltransferase